MKKTWRLVSIIIGLLVLAGIVFVWGGPARSYKDIRVGSAEVRAEIVATPVKLAQGLSGRTSMPANEGMLFIINPPGKPAFWMKDMRFSLDFVYLRDQRVVEIKENIAPSSAAAEPEAFKPVESCDRVLEVNAGWVKTHGLKVGDAAEY